MAMRRTPLFPEQKDFIMLAPWIPAAKPVLVERQHATAAGGQGYYAAGMNWLEPVVGLSPGTACGSRVAPEAACQVGSSLSTGLAGRALDLNSYDAVMASQGGVPAPTLYPQAPAMVEATQGWQQVRYSDLFAMAANADAPRRFSASSPVFFSEDVRDDRQQPDSPRRFRASSPVFLIEDVRDDRQQPDPPRRFRASSPVFFSEDGSRQQPDAPRRFRASSPVFFSEDVRDGRQLPDAPRRFRASSPPFFSEDVRDDRQQPSTPFLLNGRIALNMELLNSVQSFSSSCEAAAPLFAPVTPDQKKGTQDGQHLGSAGSVDGGDTAKGGRGQVNVPLTFDPKAKDQLIQLHFDQGVLEQTCLTSAGLATQLQENENQEKAEQGVDLNQTPAQKPRRKKHRPKVVVEGKPKRTPKPATPKPAGDGEGTPAKGKYVQRKALNTPLETSPSLLGGEPTKVHVKRTRSAKRQLDFSDEVDKVTCQVTTNAEQAQGESIPETNIGQGTENSAGNGTSSTNAVTEGQKVDVNYSSGGIAVAMSHSNNQVLDSYLKSLDTPFYRLQPSRRELIRENLKRLASLRDSRQVPNHESAIRSEIQAVCLSAPENSSTSASASNMSPRDENMGRSEWNTESNLLTDDDARPHKVNVVPTEFNLAQTCDFNKVNGISKYSRDRNNHLPCFPETPKKRRTQKVQNGPAFNQVASFADAQRILKFEKLHPMESRQAPSAQTEVKTRKRSQVPSQCSKLDSLTDMKSGQLPADTQNTQVDNERQENGIIHEPQDCLEALAVDNLAKVRRKRRTKKGQIQDFGISLEPCNTSNCCGAAVPYVQGNDHLLDVIVHGMKCLNINRDPEENKDHEQSAIVPYGGHGMLIPFEGQFDPRKKSRPRAKVDLDQETNRAWNLLMGKENYDGIEGTDIDKEKWWEGERQVFHGRADSFISRMHLVQGDRRFSPWKGSVLDSVIGVFLTQNVSDHLSSSAFMALAARFPRQSRGKDKETICNKGTTSTVQSVVCTIDLNMTENGSNQQALDHVHMVVHEAKQKGEKEMHSAGGGIEGDTFPYLNTFNVPLREIRSLTESDDRRPLDDTHSSENSSDDPVLTAEQFGSISESKSEAVDMLPATVCNLESRASFVELLEMATTSGFQEFCSCRSGRSCETESFNKECTSVLQHRWPLGEGESSFSPVIPVEFKNLDNRAPAENATEKSVTASQSVSSDDSHAFIANLANQSLSGSRTNIGHGKHLCDNYMLTRATTEALTTNNYHNDFGLLEERTTEIQRKERRSCIFVKNIMNGFEALSETEKSIAQHVYSSPVYLREKSVVAECFGEVDKGKYVSDKAVKENSKEEVCSSLKNPTGEASSAHGTRRGKSEKNKNFDWESLRRQTCQNGTKKERSSDTMDSLDWDAVRNADVNEISNTIRERGMNNMLAERIKSFLDRLVKEHGSIDLEWLRDIPPDKAKDYLLSIRGLGLKSVECVRLLTLHHLAFPVDTNVGRICVRLGWVPLQPLPESLQLHLLELYPVLETIQKYLWPRLCTLDQRTLYELHYQMITFGKVFCTKSKPNCNACPMRGECKHFASAFASARLALPGPEEKILVTTSMEQNHKTVTNPWPLPRLEGYSLMQEVRVVSNCEPIIEEPATPEPECTQILDIPDIEDAFCEDPDEIPTIQLNAKEFAQNLQSYMQQNNMELQNVDWSKALVTLTPDAASIPMPKLKNVSRLRTEHQVYELPDSHLLLEGLDQREPQDPCPYLLAIWTPGETAQSTEPPESCFDAQGEGRLCDKQTCFSCSSIREAQAQMVRGTLLIPCRTAMRGSFPLNGTYFQVNEVFADHDSSLTPIDVPRALIWNLPRRTVYFGTSVPTIFRGLAIEDIQNCFWRGFVCVRGFDRKSRGPRPLMARLHFPASKAPRGKKAATKDGEQTMQETRK